MHEKPVNMTKPANMLSFLWMSQLIYLLILGVVNDEIIINKSLDMILLSVFSVLFICKS